jgi:hypothetical protein
VAWRGNGCQPDKVPAVERIRRAERVSYSPRELRLPADTDKENKRQPETAAASIHIPASIPALQQRLPPPVDWAPLPTVADTKIVPTPSSLRRTGCAHAFADCATSRVVATSVIPQNLFQVPGKRPNEGPGRLPYRACRADPTISPAAWPGTQRADVSANRPDAKRKARL